MRKLIWISGNKNWCTNNVNYLVNKLPQQSQNIVYCGTDDQTLTKQQVNVSSSSKRAEIEQYLGTQCTVLIINCFDGFNPDIFCALCGTVQSPGIIVLMTPHADQWPDYADPDYLSLCSYPFTHKDINGRYIKYITHKLKNFEPSESIICLSEQQSQLHESINNSRSKLNQLFSDPASNYTKEMVFSRQHKQIIKSIKDLLDHRVSGVLILSGKRGRGKSSILGIALNMYAKNNNNPINVSVVSQTRSNVQPLLKQFSEAKLADTTHELSRQSLCLSYSPPDEFIKSHKNLDLLIIDEAASIPLPQLYKILDTYPDVILSTTTDGYEGTGMGFSSKLNTFLAQRNAPITKINLTQSLRWSENDAIEQLLDSTFMLKNVDASKINIDHKELKLTELEVQSFEIQKLDRDNLITNPILISQLFTLLSSAHYRTTPDDLRFLLDAPDIELWVVQLNGEIIAAMMTAREGGLPEGLHEDIWLGKRRLRGHLLPQCLSAQCGFIQASRPHYKRILRIAVYPHYQKLGIGSKLVNQAFDQDIKLTDIDYYGVSFGFETKLFKFWNSLGFFCVKLGYRKNARSGSQSLIMLKPCSEEYSTLSKNVHKRYRDEIGYLSTHPELTHQSDNVCIDNGQKYTENYSQCENQDRLDIYSFAYGNRQLAHCHWILSKYANQFLNNPDVRNLISTQQINLLTFKILQNKPWKKTADLLGYTGKKQTLSNLRIVFEIIHNAVWGNKS